MVNNYRIDKETGAVIFKKQVGKKLSQRVSALEKQNEKLRKQNSKLQKEINELNKKVDSLLNNREEVVK